MIIFSLSFFLSQAIKTSFHEILFVSQPALITSVLLTPFTFNVLLADFRWAFIPEIFNFSLKTHQYGYRGPPLETAP
jgi:hypothetical protein